MSDRQPKTPAELARIKQDVADGYYDSPEFEMPDHCMAEMMGDIFGIPDHEKAFEARVCRKPGFSRGGLIAVIVVCVCMVAVIGLAVWG